MGRLTAPGPRQNPIGAVRSETLPSSCRSESRKALPLLERVASRAYDRRLGPLHRETNYHPGRPVFLSAGSLARFLDIHRPPKKQPFIPIEVAMKAMKEAPLEPKLDRQNVGQSLSPPGHRAVKTLRYLDTLRKRFRHTNALENSELATNELAEFRLLSGR